MIGSLFAASIGFLGYMIYALVDEQVACNKAKVATHPAQKAKPLNANTKAKASTKSKSTTTQKTATTKPAAAKNKTVAKPTKTQLNDMLAYLKQNGQTSIAKLTRELPGGKKAVEDTINQLLEEGKISQSTVGRAKSVGLIS